MYSVEFSPDLAQTQVRETISGGCLDPKDTPIQDWNKVELMRRDFDEHHMTQLPITEDKQLGEMQIMKEVSEHMGKKSHLDS